MSAVVSRSLLVAELFGPTLQGEGPSCGERAVLVRLLRCNLACPACDTPRSTAAALRDLSSGVWSGVAGPGRVLEVVGLVPGRG